MKPLSKNKQFCIGLILLSVFALMTATYSCADIYRQVGSDGSLTFTDTPTDNDWQVHFSKDSTIFEIIRFFAEKYDLEDALIRAVIKVESNYEATVVSQKGAMGMMQLVPTTAAEMEVADPLDVVDNIRGGSRYLRLMMNRFNGNLDLALAAYNAGPGTVRRYGGIPPYTETINYVRKVRQYLQAYRVEEESLL